MGNANFILNIRQNLTDSEFNELKTHLARFFEKAGFEVQSTHRATGSTIVELCLFFSGSAGVWLLQTIAGEEITSAYKRLKTKFWIGGKKRESEVINEVLSQPALANEISENMSIQKNSDHLLLPDEILKYAQMEGLNIYKIELQGITPAGFDFKFVQEIKSDDNIINYTFSFSKPLNPTKI